MNLSPLQIGSVTIDFPVVLAPMAGYTDAAMRTLCLEHGAGAVYTELTSAEGIRRDSLNTFAVLATNTSEHPIAGHIFGRDPEAMVEAAKYVEQTGQFDWIDINCGCPVKKVVSRGAGAALLKDMSLLGEITSKIKAAVSLPVSVKTRIGFNQDTANHLEIAKVVEESGADMIAVHARLAKNFHGGDPDWEKLGEMKQQLTIPMVGNGGVLTVEDAAEMIRVSGVDGVMIGRGAIGNPWIFEQVKNEFLAEAQRTQSKIEQSLRSQRLCEEYINVKDRRDMMAEHLRRLVELNEKKQAVSKRAKKYTAEEAACIQFRTHIPYYVKGLYAKKQLLMKLASLKTVNAIMEKVDELMERNSDSRSNAEGAE